MYENKNGKKLQTQTNGSLTIFDKDGQWFQKHIMPRSIILIFPEMKIMIQTIILKCKLPIRTKHGDGILYFIIN